MPDDKDAQDSSQATLANDVVGLVNAALGVGAAMARTVAQATTDEEIPARGDRPPLEEMVRLSATAAGNVVSLVVDGAKASLNRVPTAGPGRDTSTGQRPRVTAGSTLRVPLLIENSSETGVDAVAFVTESVERIGAADGESGGLQPDVVSFTPTVVSLGARDFEKVTVRVRTDLQTPPGHYRAVISGGDGWFSTSIEFDVVTLTG